jgi:hypothetical protein
MALTARTAICQDCDWQVTGSSAWSAADIHEADTGHTVRRTGPGAMAARPDPFTQPHEDDPTAQ